MCIVDAVCCPGSFDMVGLCHCSLHWLRDELFMIVCYVYFQVKNTGMGVRVTGLRLIPAHLDPR